MSSPSFAGQADFPLGIGCGITLNPDQDYGMDFEAQDVAQIAAMRDAIQT